MWKTENSRLIYFFSFKKNLLKSAIEKPWKCYQVKSSLKSAKFMHWWQEWIIISSFENQSNFLWVLPLAEYSAAKVMKWQIIIFYQHSQTKLFRSQSNSCHSFKSFLKTGYYLLESVRTWADRLESTIAITCTFKT